MDIANHFIVGMSRGGTTWVGKCLNEHPDTAVFGESLFWGRAYIEPSEEDGTYTAKQVVQILDSIKQHACSAFIGEGAGNLKTINQHNWPQIVDELSLEISLSPTPDELYSLLAGKVAKHEGKKISIEKTPHHVNWIGRITSYFPNARFVIMLREPYAFMLSYKYQGNRYQSRLGKKFKRLYHPIMCAFLWRAYFRSIVSAHVRYPENALVVLTEDLRKNPDEALSRIQTFFALKKIDKLSEHIPPDNSSFTSDERPTLKSEDVFWMNLIAGHDIRKFEKTFGFTVKDTPVCFLPVVKSLLAFPLWVVWATFHLYRTTESSVWRYLMSWIYRFSSVS